MILIRHSVLLIVLLSIISCSDSSVKANSSEIDSSTINKASETSDLAVEVKSSTPWQGKAQGYVVTNSPANNRIALLVEVGKIRIQAETYNNTKSYYATSSASEEEVADWPNRLRATFNQQTLDDYAAIDELVQQVREVDIVNVLTELITDESIAAAINMEYEARDAQNGQFRKAQEIAGQLEDVNERLFPTRKEYLYLASALLRIGGDYAAQGIGQNGIVHDLQSASQAYSSSLIAYDSHSRWISYCDEQRSVIDSFRDALYDLGEKTFAQKLGTQLTVTASDFYAFATKALVTAETLPETDEEICP